MRFIASAMYWADNTPSKNRQTISTANEGITVSEETSNEPKVK